MFLKQGKHITSLDTSNESVDDDAECEDDTSSDGDSEMEYVYLDKGLRVGDNQNSCSETDHDASGSQGPDKPDIAEELEPFEGDLVQPPVLSGKVRHPWTMDVVGALFGVAVEFQQLQEFRRHFKLP